MLRLIPVFGLILSFIISFALEPQLKLNKLNLIGMKDMAEHGILLISGSGSKKMELTRVDADMELKWKTSIDIPKLRGYHFNKVLVAYNSNFIYWVNQTEELKQVSLIDMSTGEFVREEFMTPDETRSFFDLESSVVAFATDSELWTVGGGSSVNSLCRLGSDKTFNLLNVPDSLSDHHFRWIYGNEKSIYGYGYLASPNHDEIIMNVYRYAIETGTFTQIHEHSLKLDFSSFTYNSMLDKELLYLTQKGKHTYALGKLDHAFKKKYPSAKMSEAFVGFWIAKFDAEMNLIYFSEIPFQYFEGYVHKDAVTKSAVLDIKEDVNSNLILTISELKNILYGRKYVITLDSLGFNKAITGGQDFYNFFEYNNRGLHSCATKSQVRIMNDDWGYYANSSWHTMTFIEEHHSKLLLNIQTLSRENRSRADELSYTFRTHGNEHWLLEHSEKNSGSLNIYRFYVH
ncbi:MAG: hypothetical protein JXR19_02650 [Bacteroidia bacterium]